MPKNNIMKGKDGRYRYRTTNADGKRVEIRSKVNERKRDFIARCDVLDRTSETTTTTETFDDLFYLWLEEHVKMKCSKSHYRVCARSYKNYIKPYIGRKNLHTIKRKDVYELLTHADVSGLSKSTIQKIRLCISAPYAWAQNALGLDISSPTVGMQYQYMQKKSHKRSRVISAEDVSRILKAAKSSKYYNYFRILILTGLRPSEALGLQIRDINLEKNVLEIHRGITADGLSKLKTDLAERNIPLSDQLKAVLIDQRNRIAFATMEGWLFPSANGMPNMQNVVIVLQHILKQTEVWEHDEQNHKKKTRCITPAVTCSLYDFRHTFATRMAEQNIHPKMLQALMGHSDIKTTLSYYVNTTEKMEEEAKKAMDAVPWIR
ncbi:tyrosine-type recombinase/integrase [Peptoniphilaceae bacterium SGI.137]